MIHGRLLLAGGKGAEGLDCYEAACVAWAFLDETFSNEFSRPEGREALRSQLLGTLVSEQDELGELVQIMNPKGLNAPKERPRQPVNETMGDVSELRLLMAPEVPDDEE